jgi:hypothetical protein
LVGAFYIGTSAWTSADSFAPTPLIAQAGWLSTDLDTNNPSSLISFDYDWTDFTADSGDKIYCSFLASVNNAPDGVEYLKTADDIAPVSSIEWQTSRLP